MAKKRRRKSKPKTGRRPRKKRAVKDERATTEPVDQVSDESGSESVSGEEEEATETALALAETLASTGKGDQQDDSGDDTTEEEETEEAVSPEAASSHQEDTTPSSDGEQLAAIVAPSDESAAPSVDGDTPQEELDEPASPQLETDTVRSREEELSRTIEGLRANLALLPSLDEELEKLRQENRGLTTKLWQFESAKSEIESYRARLEQLKEELASERARRKGLEQKAAHLDIREQELDELEDALQELTASWGAGRVKQLELERNGYREQLEVLEGRLADGETQLKSLRAELDGLDVVGVEGMRERIKDLEDENRALYNELRKMENHRDHLLTNVERMRHATQLLEENSRLREAVTSLEYERDVLQSKVAELDTYKSLVERSKLVVQELKEQLDTVNQSEKMRLERGERAFDSLFAEFRDASFHRELKNIHDWPGDDAAVERILEVVQKQDFIFSKMQIRWMLASVRSSRLIILKGFSGLGKTSLPILTAVALGAPYEVIPVQPGWRSRTDLMGFFNHFEYRFLPTEFAKALLKANLPAFRDRHFFIVLDEMNLAHVEYYFNDFLVKLEESEEPLVELFDHASIDIQLPASGIGQYIRGGQKIRVPKNVTFFGTINDDETTFQISDKVYDRAQVIQFYDDSLLTRKGGARGRLPSKDELREGYKKEVFSYSSYYEQWETGPESADVRYSKIEDFLSRLNSELRGRFYLMLSHRPRRQINNFVRAYELADGTLSEALDLQIISKVIPKIRYSHRQDFEEDLRQFGGFLEKEWPYPNQGPSETLKVLRLLKAQL